MFTPTKPPAVSTPDSQAIASYLNDELQSLASDLRSPDSISFAVTFVAPGRPRTGLTVYADGTKWNPGNGEGLYTYNAAGVWVWLEAPVASGYLTPADIGVTVQGFDAQLSSNMRQNSQSAAYTLVATDAEKHIFHPSADTTARVWTIPANASVPFPIGTMITFVNQNGAGVITIAITTDTLRFAGSGSTGSRTLAANGLVTALKVTTTEWIISGAGLS